MPTQVVTEKPVPESQKSNWQKFLDWLKAWWK